MSLIYPKRIRSILNGESPKLTFGGFTKKEDNKKTILNTIKGKDGKLYEVFEEDGKRYVMNGNNKVNVKFIEEDSVTMPMFCPKCKHIMKSHLDKKMWNIHSVCFNCAIKIEDNLRKTNEWNKYQQQKVLLNKISFINEMKSELTSILENGIDSVIHFVNADGSTDKWTNTDKDKIEQYIISELEEVNNQLKLATDELESTGELLSVKYK